MPGHDGYWLLEPLRHLQGTNGAALRAIALTAFVEGEDQQRAFEAGFDRYLTKPADPSGIVTDLAELAPAPTTAAAEGAEGDNPRLLDLAPKRQDDEDDQDQAKSAAWIIAPVTAVWPEGQGPQQGEN